MTTPPRAVILDGTYLAGLCLLIATNGTQAPLARQWCSTESAPAWTGLLRRIPAPVVVVGDGDPGLQAALRSCWPDTRVQRRVFHDRRTLFGALTTARTYAIRRLPDGG